MKHLSIFDSLRLPCRSHRAGMIAVGMAICAVAGAGAQPGMKADGDTSGPAASAPAAGAPCTPFGAMPQLAQVVAGVNKPGHWCLNRDLLQRSVWDISSGLANHGSPERSGVIAVFQADGVTVDLSGHLASGAPFDDTTGLLSHSDARRVEFRNGRVETPGAKGIGVDMAPNKSVGNDEASPDDEPPMVVRRNQPPRPGPFQYEPWNYQPETDYVVDRLQIRSGGRGVTMSGKGNVIRNSVIEVDSAIAAYLYGPGSVIEGNTIIVHQVRGEPAATSAALKLLDANGAIIRNNRFIIKGGVFKGKAEVAINLLASKDVIIENNTVEGAAALVRKDAGSTTVERANTVK